VTSALSLFGHRGHGEKPSRHAQKLQISAMGALGAARRTNCAFAICYSLFTIQHSLFTITIADAFHLRGALV